MRSFHYWRGRFFLALRLCPACKSSPPLQSCTICWGSHSYGAATSPGLAGPLTDEAKASLRRRWDALR